MIELLYFAWVRERIGKNGERLELPANVGTAAQLLDWLEARGDGYAAALADRPRLRLAINQIFAPLTAPVTAGDEIAIFPPVTGG
ncbi:molybdopterin converting factor subunit 1 [Sphingoaurantiacus capsulatus]|uniref:Molybdopterin synthase sulfur carrier subunit n=1 Tax=Sphingoaurantiacus capsulatus TaxID=1771310 RepID=A0ABV7XC93_9SPHN